MSSAGAVDGATTKAKPTHKELEEGSQVHLDWGKLAKAASCGQGVVPVCVQHADTKEVLIVAYVNELALHETITRKVCVLWSTSRNELWVKGATSGDTLALAEIRMNCEQNSLLYLVRPVRTGACHTKDACGHSRPSCYYRRFIFAENGDAAASMLEHIDRPAGASAFQKAAVSPPAVALVAFAAGVAVCAMIKRSR